MEIISCPHCGMRVVAKQDGTCPSCRTDLSSKPSESVQPAALSSDAGRSVAPAPRRGSSRMKVNAAVSTITLLCLVLAGFFFGKRILTRGGDSEVSEIPAAVSPTPKGTEEHEDEVLVQGVVLTEGGNIVPEADVWLGMWHDVSLGKGRIAHETSDPQGRFQLRVPRAWIDEAFQPPTLWVHSEHHALAARELPPSTFAAKCSRSIEIVVTERDYLSCVVLDPDGDPVSGARVGMHMFFSEGNTVFSQLPDEVFSETSVETDENGVARLPVRAGDRIVELRVETSLFGTQTILAYGEATPTVQLRPTGSIRGRVVADDSKWAGSVRIVFSTEPSEMPENATAGEAVVFTDAEGLFTVPAIAEGELVVGCDAPDEAPVRPKLPEGNKTEITRGTTTEIEIPLVTGVVVHGIVQSRNGQAAPQARFNLISERPAWQSVRVVTDERGKFSARVIPGEVLLPWAVRTPDGYVSTTESTARVRTQVDVTTFELPVIEIPPVRRVEGKVIDQGGEPLVDATVHVLDGLTQYMSRHADCDGRFSILLPLDVEVGEYTVLPYHADDQVSAQVLRRDPLLLQAAVRGN
jgi:hypothetical protein